MNSLSTVKYINAPKKGIKIIIINQKIFNNIFTSLLKNSLYKDIEIKTMYKKSIK